MILGLFIIVLVGFLVVNYFRNLDRGRVTSTAEEDLRLPTTHTVKQGEDLWGIAENYYASGYNWVDIAEANDIENPDMLTVGDEILIPDVSPIVLGDEAEEIAQSDIPTPTRVPTVTKTPTPTTMQQKVIEDSELKDFQSDQAIAGDSYTVVKGDNLWNIAVRAYGDGFRWTEIAEANNLVNPSIIHRGNVFVIPR